MKRKTPKLDFSANVAEWWLGLTATQHSEVWSWLSKNAPPSDWHGSKVEWAYLSMPVPGGW